jgi:ribonuclease E
MNKRMLIDGTHPEEVRVVIADGNRLEEYDIESATKSQLKGNIYLAKVMRVEPSLQAAFVDFGGNRHGFLAFSEIHPDYYQIPMEDREALKRDVALFEENAVAAHAHIDSIDGDLTDVDDDDEADERDEADALEASAMERDDDDADDSDDTDDNADDNADADDNDENVSDVEEAVTSDGEEPSEEEESGAETDADHIGLDDENEKQAASADGDAPLAEGETSTPTDGEETKSEAKSGKAGRGRRGDRRDNPMKRYKIQEVIKRRQILLVQVVKEERGNKGAALTSYLSLAGRYCVLMPNTSRSGGGVSRKITSTTDRRRLRDLLKSLEVPEGMGVIMRTAGMERNKSEIKRDFDYLMRLWEEIRELTLNSAAPALVHEEGDLIKRTIRDLYSREIEEVLVEGNDAYQAAKKVMRMMMPSHAKRVQPYRDDAIPLFHRYQVESLLEAMHSPVVQLKSGGYIVIDQTEALVAIDVNSGRSTKERNIEETAVKTNLEAASEVALQLRLRDLAGLIVIDFIDMDESRNQRAVEKRFKEAVKNDRARMQLGQISSFGLLELSRQRLRPSLIETSSNVCTHCGGTGNVRSIESMAVRVMRMIEEEGIRDRSSEVLVTVPTAVALYILNQKRAALIAIETRCGFSVQIIGDDQISMNEAKLDHVKGRQNVNNEPEAVATTPANNTGSVRSDDASDTGEASDTDEASNTDEASDAEPQNGKSPARKRRPRRRRRKESAGDDSETAIVGDAEPRAADAGSDPSASGEQPTEIRPAETPDGETGDEENPKRRRRGRRGGRRRSQKSTQEDSDAPAIDSNNAESDGADGAADPATTDDATATQEVAEANVEPHANGSEEPAEGPGPEETNSRNGDAVIATTTDKDTTPQAVAVPAESSKEDGSSPQRRGWWKRMMD